MVKSDIKRLENTRDGHVSQLNKADKELEEAEIQTKSYKSDIAALAGFITEMLEANNSVSLPSDVFSVLKKHNINLLPKNKVIYIS